jgi:prephenate dehydrogenase
MSPEAHDRLLARTSHMPHLVAALLVDLAFGNEAEGTRDACGTGFRDATRMAAGSEDVWHDIVKTNADALVSELDAFISAAAELRGCIASGRLDEMKAFLARCRAIRAGLYRSGPGKSASGGKGADG